MRNEKKIRLLALVPHRDTRLPLRKWSASMFAAGVPGAWSFPWVAPLARLKRPLSTEELKSLARAWRQHINENGGKVTATTPALSALSGNEEKFIFGPSLQLEFPADFFAPVTEAISHRIEPLIIGAALMSGKEKKEFPAPPQISFRAAALANMVYYEEDGNFFEWKIGPLHWLPKKNQELGMRSEELEDFTLRASLVISCSDNKQRSIPNSSFLI
jgi:hypothetical protein